MQGNKISKMQPLNISQQTKNMKNYVRMIQSFKKNKMVHNRRQITQQNQYCNKTSFLEDELITLPKKKMSTPIPSNFENNKKNKVYQQNPDPQKHKNTLSKSTDAKIFRGDSKEFYLPSIRLLKMNMSTPKQSSINNLPTKPNHARHKTQVPFMPIILVKSNRKPSFQKLSFNQVQGAPNGNLMQFSRLKPTQQYFSKQENVRLAQKLLLMQPSKQLRVSEHKKFYETQKTYRQRISQSTIAKKNNPQFRKILDKKHKRLKSDWVN